MPTRKAAPRKAPPKKKAVRMGRPSEFTQARADTICRRLAEGESLRSICCDAAMPNRTTVFRWLEERDDFRNQYVRAREVQADVLAEQVVEIADKVLPAIKKTVRGKGKSRSTEEVHGDAVERSRLMMDARKWYAAKLAPKKYGDRLTQEHTGPDGGPILMEQIAANPKSRLTVR
jgi:hypothetical protein